MSLRPTKQDLDNIAKIQLDRGGINRSDAMRVALQECASKKPTLAVIPAMAPPKDLNAILKAMQSFSEDLLYIAETGLPVTAPDTSPSDRQTIEQARAKFRSVYDQVDEMILKHELFLRLVAALQNCEVAKLQIAVERMAMMHRQHHKRIQNPGTTDALRKTSQIWLQEVSGPLLEWFRACGLLPPPGNE